MISKYNSVNDNECQWAYNAGNDVINNIEVLKSNLSHYNDASILVRGDITIAAIQATKVAFKKCVPLTKCITKIDRTTIDDAEDINLVIPVYNLLEYSLNYSDATVSLWFYSKDEPINFDNDIANIELLGNTLAQPTLNQDNGILKHATIAASLKYLNNFSRSLEILLINCKVELTLRWRKHCVLSVLGNENDKANANSTNIIFTIKDTKHCMKNHISQVPEYHGKLEKTK